MLNALKTQDKFNPYLIIIPATVALAAWQGGLIVTGGAKLAYETIQKKRSNEK